MQENLTDLNIVLLTLHNFYFKVLKKIYKKDQEGTYLVIITNFLIELKT